MLEERYRVRVPPGALSRTGYLAGSDARRAGELNDLLRDPDVRAVFFARGGYGATRILDDLDAAALAADPIPLVGFSDSTALLGWAAAAAGVAAIHGPVARQLPRLPAEDLAWLFALLESTEPAGALGAGLQPAGVAGGPLEGTLWGGNLSLVAHLVATPHWPEAEDAVFFFEDIGERPYAIDRYLTRLAAAGALDGVRGALVGEMTACEETKADDHPGAAEVIDERLARFAIPALVGAPFGHGGRNRALPFGGRVALDPASGSAILLSPAVAK